MQSLFIQAVKMKPFEAFKIPIMSLENKVYEYEMEGHSDFFEAFEQEWIEKGAFQVKVKLDKSPTMIQVYLHIEAVLQMICDRSLEEFDYPIDVNEKLIFKFADHSEDMGDNLYLLDRKEPYLDLSQDIYDFIAIQVPMKKLHPRFVDKNDHSTNDEFLYTTETEEEVVQKEQEIDPRWNILKNLTDNNKK
ncbi:MAG: hypothetical protein RJA76_1031 [Bacteroidota bacterium]